MKTNIVFLLLIVSLISCTETGKKVITQTGAIYDSAGVTNNFYDNTPSQPLALREISVDGEVDNPGRVDLSGLPSRSVFVKETLLDSAGSDRFIGAYRYDGYSLFDILDRIVIRKANSKEFNPIIDLYVEVSNDEGDKAVFSWGEIFYPNNLHRIIIADRVSRIIPSKTKDLWPLPVTSKIVAGSDLITERNISNPSRITVKSYSGSFPVNRGISPLYSKSISLRKGEEKLSDISPEIKNPVIYNTVFYGRGKGIHSTSPFKGAILRDILLPYYPMSSTSLKTGLFCLAAVDGYRCVLTYSEIFNRNDQQEFLLVRTAENEDGGLFRVFAAGDFFSDRAVKSLKTVIMFN